MNASFSLRIRLTLIILAPLLIICGLVAIWAVWDARERAEDRFDRSLLSTALAISRDVAVSGGDALSPETNTLLRSTSGGVVFYHVYAPDGVFVTGYATPPVAADQGEADANQTYFDGRHQSRDVRVLRFVDAMQIDGLTGDFTVTVWQDMDLRSAIARDLSWRTFRVMASLFLAVGLIVWFGVRFGLSPLISLEEAISRRSPDDLTAIKRAVPVEASGIVAKLNDLLVQVASTLKTKDDFISDAAHQLRNPIAGILAMSSAVQSAKSMEDVRNRSDDLVAAATKASDLANNLLTYERARAEPTTPYAQHSVTSMIAEIVEDMRPICADAGVTLIENVPSGDIVANVDPTMVKEAVLNLVNNALLHGGPQLTQITVALSGDPCLTVSVSDNGKGIPDALHDVSTERFKQIKPADGSGLGLAIVKAVAERHSGKVLLKSLSPGLSVTMQLARS